MLPVFTSPRGFKNAIFAAVWVAVTSIVLRTSESVSVFAGPSPLASCETEPTVLDGFGVALDRTKSAQDLGGAGGEAGLRISADNSGDVSEAAGTDVEDECFGSSKTDSSCGVEEVKETTLTESR